jgi:hypothetical protein
LPFQGTERVLYYCLALLVAMVCRYFGVKVAL